MISYDEAEVILRAIGGTASPSEWQGGLEAAYNLGPNLIDNFTIKINDPSNNLINNGPPPLMSMLNGPPPLNNLMNNGPPPLMSMMNGPPPLMSMMSGPPPLTSMMNGPPNLSNL